MTLDIAGVGDVILKTFFGTSWTLKDVRYIPGLKRRLISVGQLDEEGYHVVFEDQQWKVTKGSLAVVRGNKRGSLYMVEIGMDMLASKGNVLDVRKVDIYSCKPGGLGKQKKISFIMSVKTMKLERRCGRYNANLQFGVTERLSRTFRAESTGFRVEAPKMLWADSVSTTFLIYRISYFPIWLRILEEEWRWKDTSLAHLKAAAQMKYDTVFGLRESPGYPKQRYYICVLDLWSQSLGGSSDTSEGSKNSDSFEDSGKSDEEYTKDEASSKEGGSKTPQVRRSTKESRALVMYYSLANYLPLIENGEPESNSEALSSKQSVQWKKDIIKEMVSLKKNQTCFLVRISARKKASQRL
nr:hypothetical protein [Tanacetum cinerariifolium]